MRDVSGHGGSFGERNFGHLDLGDARRTRRLVWAADEILAHPAEPLPDKFLDPAGYRAVLRLANRPEVTHAAILGAHAGVALDRLRGPGGPAVVVLAEDTTELDFSGHSTLALGPIGNGGGQGYECHGTLAVDPDSREALGLLDQILHRRPRLARAAGVRASREDPARESLLWLAAASNVGAAPDGKLWVRVCDRGADTFEYLEHMTANRLPFVFRSGHNRALEAGDGGDRGDGPVLLHDRLRALPAQASWDVGVSGQPGRPARVAAVCAAAERARLRAPHVRRGRHGRGPVEAWAVRVWEPSPPGGAEPLEWLLLTDQDVSDPAALRRAVGYYECRSVVEEFHKGMKTGAGVEKLQLQSRAGLEPLIALLSVVAVALLNLRVAARDEGAAQEPARRHVPPSWVEVLSTWRHNEVRDLTVREFTIALARLGGHLNRKSDGLPGWLTLWRGWERLHTMLEYELARATCGKQ